MDAAILDTDVLSELLKGKNARIQSHAREYLAEHQRLAFSALTAYEIMRGLHASAAARQLDRFSTLISTSEVLEVTMTVLSRAAELWAEATQGGHPRNDADLIIAATALTGGRVLVTGNTRHFDWIAGLVLTDWHGRKEL